MALELGSATSPLITAGERGRRLNHTLGTAGGTAPITRRALRAPGMAAALDLLALAAWMKLSQPPRSPALLVLAWLPLQLLVTGKYKRRIGAELLGHLRVPLNALAAPILVLVVIGPATGHPVLEKIPELALLLTAGRVLSYSMERMARAGVAAEPALIMGAGRLGCQIANTLLSHPEYGIRPVGFVDDFPDDGTLPVPIVGRTSSFDAAVRQTGARRVFVAYGASREPELVEVLRASTATDVAVHVVPRLFELGVSTAGPDAHLLWGLPIHDTCRAAHPGIEWRAKRAFDLVVAVLCLLAAAPIMAVTALAIAVTSRGPVLFRQIRVGQRGVPIEIYKFRSMRVSSDADTRWAGRDDDRITWVGRLIRATSIDELPQLLNVLKGDMSLVGPRPERPHFSEQFARTVYHYNDRLRVPVGLTGWAQVHGLRGDTSIEERARFDNYYIEHWSLSLDCIILLRTFLQVAQEIGGHLRRERPCPAIPQEGSKYQAPDVSGCADTTAQARGAGGKPQVVTGPAIAD